MVYNFLLKNKKREKLSLSIGVASIGKSTDIKDIIDRADKAMYMAKYKRGKNCVAKYSEIR